jgi:hypothetical protein
MSISDLLVQQILARRVMRDTWFEPERPEARHAAHASTSTMTRMRSALATILIATGERLRPRPIAIPCGETMQPQPCR